MRLWKGFHRDPEAINPRFEQLYKAVASKKRAKGMKDAGNTRIKIIKRVVKRRWGTIFRTGVIF